MKSHLLLALAMALVSGCTREPAERTAGRYIPVSNGPVEFLFPASWYENDQDHPYDLQCFSQHKRMNTGIFLFLRENLAAHLTPRDILELQIEDIESKRDNFTVKEPEQVVQEDGKKLTSIVYAGEKGPSQYYYRFTLVEFADAPHLIPVVLQVAIPSYWARHKPVLEGITKSARVRPRAAAQP